MYMYVYMCVHVCVYMCMCICMYMYICVSVYIYAYTCICTRVWVYICTRIGAFCLFILSNHLSTTFVCITGVFLTPACVSGGECFDTGRDRGFVLYISLFLRVLWWWLGA